MYSVYHISLEMAAEMLPIDASQNAWKIRVSEEKTLVVMQLYSIPGASAEDESICYV